MSEATLAILALCSSVIRNPQPSPGGIFVLAPLHLPVGLPSGSVLAPITARRRCGNRAELAPTRGGSIRFVSEPIRQNRLRDNPLRCHPRRIERQAKGVVVGEIWRRDKRLDLRPQHKHVSVSICLAGVGGLGSKVRYHGLFEGVGDVDGRFVCVGGLHGARYRRELDI